MKSKKLFSIIISLLIIVGGAFSAFATTELNLEAIYGDLLSDIDLPEEYEWSTKNPSTFSVGNAGKNAFYVLHKMNSKTVEETVIISVSPAYISEVNVQTDGSKYYTDDPGEPDINLSFKGNALVKDTDYMITYDKVNSGISKVTIEGIGNFQGKTSVTVYVEKQDVEAVEINETELELNPGEAYQLAASVIPATATFKDIVWSSSDEDIAKVDETGYVTALKNGVTNIVAKSKDGGLQAECIVRVTTDAAGITIPVSRVHLFCKEKYQLKTIISPFDVSNSDVIWSSSDESVAKVDENGVITAVGRGETTVTATTVDGGYSDTCEVSVHYTWWQAIIWLFFGCLWYF